MSLPIQIFTDNTFRSVQKNIIESNVILSVPYKVGFIATDSETTVDIEPGIELIVDDGCVLIITEN